MINAVEGPDGRHVWWQGKLDIGYFRPTAWLSPPEDDHRIDRSPRAGQAQAALFISNVELSGSTVLSLKGSIDQAQIEP